METQYIIRLDDACPQMNHENWNRMEKLLDQYEIKPIVGIIPMNKDLDFTWDVDPNFWKKASNWQEKNWIIAQHGYKHRFLPDAHRRCFQKTHSLHTEWAGLPFDKQKEMMQEGNTILRKHGLLPTCFFAPSHTFDSVTVDVCKDIEGIRFISDGYSLYPYKKKGMIFFPSICDGPFSMPISGCFTFVVHPSIMSDALFIRWSEFIKKNVNNITTPATIIDKMNIRKNQGLVGHALEWGIYIARSLRSCIR